MIIDVTPFERRGFCDRLRQITFCVAIARFEGDTTLCLKEQVSEECPFTFFDLCTVKGFSMERWTPEKGAATYTLPSMHSYPMLPNAIMHKPRGVRMSDREFLREWKSAYALLEPRPEIAPMIDALGVGRDTIGVHIRMTDKLRGKDIGWELEAGDISSVNGILARRIDEIARAKGTRKIFLAADNGDSKTEWRNTLSASYDVVSHASTFTTSRLRQTSGADFIVDFFSLSRCGAIVSTVPSSVSHGASLVGGVDNFIANEGLAGVKWRARIDYMGRWARAIGGRILSRDGNDQA